MWLINQHKNEWFYSFGKINSYLLKTLVTILENTACAFAIPNDNILTMRYCLSVIIKMDMNKMLII